MDLKLSPSELLTLHDVIVEYTRNVSLCGPLGEKIPQEIATIKERIRSCIISELKRTPAEQAAAHEKWEKHQAKLISDLLPKKVVTSNINVEVNEKEVEKLLADPDFSLLRATTILNDDSDEISKFVKYPKKSKRPPRPVMPHPQKHSRPIMYR